MSLKFAGLSVNVTPDANARAHKVAQKFQRYGINEYLNSPESPVRIFLDAWCGPLKVRELLISVVFYSTNSEPPWKTELRGKRNLEIDLVVRDSEVETVSLGKTDRETMETFSWILCSRAIGFADASRVSESEAAHRVQQSNLAVADPPHATRSPMDEVINAAAAAGKPASWDTYASLVESLLDQRSSEFVALYWLEQLDIIHELRQNDISACYSSLSGEVAGDEDAERMSLALIAAGPNAVSDFLASASGAEATSTVMHHLQTLGLNFFDSEVFGAAAANILAKRQSRYFDILANVESRY